jgi:hypothetical protein
MGALVVYKWRILCTLGTMAGYEPIQIRKQATNFGVVMEALAGSVFGMLYQRSPNTHLMSRPEVVPPMDWKRNTQPQHQETTNTGIRSH